MRARLSEHMILGGADGGIGPTEVGSPAIGEDQEIEVGNRGSEAGGGSMVSKASTKSSRCRVRRLPPSSLYLNGQLGWSAPMRSI